MAEAVDKTKFFAIKISDDHMKVYLTVKPFVQKDIDINLNDVLQTLQSKSISFGIKEDVIKTTLDEVKQENISVENLLIAEGNQAINGEDGRLEFMVNVNKNIKPHEDTHGKVDFHDLSIVENVEKEQPLVKLVDSTLGTPGKNVYGKMVNPVHGKPCVLPIGENTKVSDKDTKLLVSCINGIVKYVAGGVSVKPGYAVQTDVETGIDYTAHQSEMRSGKGTSGRQTV